MEIKDLKKAEITDKKTLRDFRYAERIKLLLRFHKYLYAIYLRLGESKMETLLMSLAELKSGSTSEIELQRVSAYTGIPIEDFNLKTRKRDIVEARQVAMYLAKARTKESLAKIGLAIGKKDHATVLHAIKTVSNLIETDRAFRDKWGELLNLSK